MVAYKVEAFGGMAPAIDDRLLSPNAASHAVNAWLDVGNLSGFYALKEIQLAPINIGKVYRIPNNYDRSDDFAESKYMFFENPDTDVIRGATFGDTHDRYYWASTTSPPQYNTRARILADDPPWILGIPTPTTPPTVDVTGGTGTTLTRAYVVTFVSEYGEEGAPSPAGLGTGAVDGAWDISDIPVPVAGDMGVDRNITHKRLYRTITSSSGVATFFLVTELLSTVTDYNDILLDTAIVGNKQLDTTFYTPPPADLEGFCMGANGMLAGWRGNEVWFSEPYRPHAWPVIYVLTVEYPIVGIASIFQTFFIMTRGYPVTITGASPINLIPTRVTVFEPCTSRGGIVVFPEGVYYPSGNGLMLLQLGAAANITKGLITKERWQSYVRGAEFRAGRLGNVYYGYGTVQFGVFQEDAFQVDAFQQQDFHGANNGIFINPTDMRLALTLLTTDTPVNNVQNDAWTSELFILKENKVFWIDLTDPNQIILPALWKSKSFPCDWPRSYGAAKIYFTLPSNTPAQNPVRNTDQDPDRVLETGEYALIKWYGNDRLLAIHELRKSGELLRLPAETKYDTFSFEVESIVDVHSVHWASTAKELRNV